MNINTDFIKWAFSNPLDNSLRGVIAEYLVHKAVGSISRHRINWDGYDIEMQDGTKIEIKTSGYVQSWPQRKPSVLVFDIGPKDPWLALENRSLGSKCRYADIWVFAVHAETDRNKANPFEPSQWKFLVTSSKWLNSMFNDQKSTRYSVLVGKGLRPVQYSQLFEAIQDVKRTTL